VTTSQLIQDQKPGAARREGHPGVALTVIAACQLMVVLDATIVNIALPHIQDALKFSTTDLTWVVSAYTLTFGGLLLLGGRAADLVGRRRMFMIGLVLFSAASLVCGLSTSEAMLITARAIQGVGAAIISPAALSILTTTFAEGKERNTALGVWGAIAGTGGAAGVLLGGDLTDWVGWEWIFFINVPIGLAVIALAPRLLQESRVESDERRFDVAGAASVTLGLVVLVYALVGTTTHSWIAPRTLGLFALSAVLLIVFVAIELRVAEPVLPLSIFRLRTLAGANIVGFLLGSSIFSMFYFLSLYQQFVLGYSPLKTGIGYLAIAVTIIISAAVSQAIVTRVGVRPVLTLGMVLLTIGLLWFTQIDAHGSYATDLLPGYLLAGVGLGFAFVPDAIAALEGVTPEQAGIASGLINTSQQIGGALGVAILTTVAATRTENLGPAAGLGGLTSGYRYGFAVAAGMAVIGVVASLVTIRTGLLEPEPERATA
jgi:EmrB/QacA subfamily drug resistance transporter